LIALANSARNTTIEPGQIELRDAGDFEPLCTELVEHQQRAGGGCNGGQASSGKVSTSGSGGHTQVTQQPRMGQCLATLERCAVFLGADFGQTTLVLIAGQQAQ
jgi:hypothetical protein